MDGDIIKVAVIIKIRYGNAVRVNTVFGLIQHGEIAGAVIYINSCAFTGGSAEPARYKIKISVVIQIGHCQRGGESARASD